MERHLRGSCGSVRRGLVVVVVVVRVGVADEGYGVGLENGEKWSVCVCV